MNAWPDTDGRTIARYLGQLRLRCSTSRIYYRQALRTFQEVVIRDQRTPGQLGREVLETWLREYAMHWPMATLLYGSAGNIVLRALSTSFSVRRTSWHDYHPEDEVLLCNRQSPHVLALSNGLY